MALTRMELFNRLVLAITYELQQGFPRVHRLNFEALELVANIDAEARTACEKIFVETVLWLKDEPHRRTLRQTGKAKV